MARVSEPQEAAEEKNRRILNKAKMDLDRMVKEATCGPDYCGTVRVEIGIKNGDIVFGRQCADETYK